MIDKYLVREYSYYVPRYKDINRRKGVCVMRISSIHVAQPTNVNYSLKRRNAQTNQMQTSQMNFKSWKSSAGAVGGALLGLGLGTVLSGGLLAPLLLTCSGCYIGNMYGISKEDDKNNNDWDYESYV